MNLRAGRVSVESTMFALLMLVGSLWKASEASPLTVPELSKVNRHDQVPVPLVLPADPSVACSKAVFLRFTKVNTICTFTDAKPEPECCEALVRYFGMHSQKPSRNCFCVPEVWRRLTATQAYHNMPFEQIFQNCSQASYTVPFYQEGEGYCSGRGQVERVSSPALTPPHASDFSSWAAGLHSDWLVMTAFISIITAVPGFLLFLWPFIFDVALMARDMASTYRARQLHASCADQMDNRASQARPTA